MGFFRAWGFEVQHPADARVDSRNIQSATGFKRHLITGIAQLLEQRDGVWLGQGLATGHAHVARPIAGDLLEDGLETAHCAAAERVGAVAILTAQRAAGQAYENGGQPSRSCFTL